jgi:hypothetical protein
MIEHVTMNVWKCLEDKCLHVWVSKGREKPKRCPKCDRSASGNPVGRPPRPISEKREEHPESNIEQFRKSGVFGKGCSVENL